MIALTTCGLFLCASNLTLSARLLTSSPMPPLNSAPKSRLYSAITGKSDNSSAHNFFLTQGIHLRMSCPSLCLKMVKPNALFALSIMSFARCYFRIPCLPPTRSRLSPRQPPCSTSFPPRLFTSPHRTLSSMARLRRMIIYESSVANVIQTCLPLVDVRNGGPNTNE
jgi:hypothetical protein